MRRSTRSLANSANARVIVECVDTLLQPPLRITCSRDPHTADQLGLADVHGSHPGDDLVLIHRLSQHHFSSPTSTRSRMTHVTARGNHHGKELNLVLVLTRSAATMKGPQRDPRARLVDALHGA